MAAKRAPEETIRRWLDENGPVTVGTKALAQTWKIERLTAGDRRRIAAALERAGVACDPPLRRATARDKLTLSVAAAPEPVLEAEAEAAPEPEPELPPEPEPEPEPELPPEPEPSRPLYDHDAAPPEAEDEDRAPAAAALPPSDTRLLGLAAAAIALIVIGAFGPWGKAIFTTDSGFDRDGLLVIVCAAAAGAALVAYSRRGEPWALPLAAALIGAVGCGIVASNFRDISDDAYIHPGWGIYLSFFGSAALAVLGMALLARRESRSASAEPLTDR
jgi:hypothetical protein